MTEIENGAQQTPNLPERPDDLDKNAYPHTYGSEGDEA